MKHGAIVKGALRENVPDYPLAAVREAVANALMHRDYSPDAWHPGNGRLYPDRLELSNPGGLFGSLTVERLGQRGATASRNQFWLEFSRMCRIPMLMAGSVVLSKIEAQAIRRLIGSSSRP